ncbi:MAG TPA: hypothetical protein VGC13_09025 [Longimicrobium sp.]|uniref:DUF6973 domain-containing protein n=1 Tax=Longimicrobium sp. TaxID=2029185 RepID=UPI002ED8A707
MHRLILHSLRPGRAVAALALASMAACADIPTTARTPVPDLPAAQARLSRPPLPPVLEHQTPQYPAIAVYIVYREYVNKHPGIRYLSQDDPEYQRYMEKRLRELYPQQGYAGMMRDATAEMKRNRETWRRYETAQREYERSIVVDCEMPQMMSVSIQCGGGGTTTPDPSLTEYPTDPSWTGNAEYFVDENLVPTVQEEVDSLQLTSTESNGLQYYETLALAEGDFRGGIQPYSGTGASRDDLIRMAAMGPGAGGEIGIQALPLYVTIPLGIAAFFGPRIAFSWWRAVDAAGSYYPSMSEGDTRRDAFRHTYVNVLLRRYCTGPIAKLVMDTNEAWGDNPWGSRMMDYHNNDLGRSTRYEHFRGHWFWDRWSWGVWGHRVRRYIDDTRNGVFVTQFQDPAISESTARGIEYPIPDYKYIYFR